MIDPAVAKIAQVPAYLTGLRTKASGSWMLLFETNENIPPDMLEYFAARRERPGYLLFLAREATPADLVDTPALPEDREKKTPSQRLRAVLFVWWQQQGSKGEFEEFYRDRMERMIDFVKEKLT